MKILLVRIVVTMCPHRAPRAATIVRNVFGACMLMSIQAIEPPVALGYYSLFLTVRTRKRAG